MTKFLNAFAVVALTTTALATAAHSGMLPPIGGEGGYTPVPVPVPPEKFATSPGGVDMRTGRYNYQHTDLAIGGEHGISLQRTGASAYSGHDEMFSGLTSNWDIFLDEDRIQVAEANKIEEYDYVVNVFGGRSASFRSLYNPNQTSFRNTSSGGYSKLTFDYITIQSTGFRVPTVYTVTAEDGAVIRFAGPDCNSPNLCRRASEITEADGTRYTLSYSGARLRAVVSNHGYALLFDYAASIGGYHGQALISKACAINLAVNAMPTDLAAAQLCPAGVPSSTYGYSSFSHPTGGTYSDLTSFTDMGGVQTLIGDRATKIYDAGATVPKVTNTLAGDIVTAQSFADGSSYTYSWAPDQNNSANVAGGAYTNSAGKSVALYYDSYRAGVPIDNPTRLVTPSPVEIVDENGHSTTATYCGSYNPTSGVCGTDLTMKSMTDAEGIARYFTYDNLRNITQTVTKAKPGSGLADIVTSATYGCAPANACNKPLTKIDARGKQTDYTYDTAHGGVLTETGPAPSVGQPRPQTRYTYVQRSAWLSNGSGGYVQAASPIWLLASKSLCKTSAATGNPASPCSVTGDEVKTSYDYGPDSGPNTLLLRGIVEDAGGLNLRTCYGYDSQGRKISETKPRAGLSTCP
jgi:hypothetical protein